MNDPEPDKVLYSWGKRSIKRVEIFDGSTHRPEIPTGGPLARIHDRVLTNKKKSGKLFKR